MIEKQNLTEKLFYDNEVQTNRLVIVPIMILGLVQVALVILSEIGVYNFGGTVAEKATLFSGMLCLTAWPVGSYNDYCSKWLKEYLIDLVIFSSSTLFFFYPTNATFLCYGPIIASALYYNRKTIRKTAVISWVIYSIFLWLNVFLELYYPPMHNFHVWLEIAHLFSLPREIFADYFATHTIYFIITTMVCDAIAKRGREFVIKQASITHEVAQMENELSAATKMQLSSLPDKHFISENNNIVVNTFMRPAKAVGGDFYDYFMVEDNLVFLVADVSDKGLPAAMFMMKAKNAVRSAFHTKENFEKSVEIANFLMYNDNNENMFTTMWIACINSKTGVGKYANCGHLYPFLHHCDGSVERIENEPDLMLGLFEKPDIKTHLLRLNSKDTLIAFTDGLTDAVNRDGERFGEERLHNLISAIPEIRPDTGDLLIKHIDDFVGDTDQFDDMTSIGIHFKKSIEPSEDHLTVTAKKGSSSIVIDSINRVLEANNCPEYDRRNINVALDEVCENIKEYAFTDSNEEYDVFYSVSVNYIEIEFVDKGEYFNPLEEDSEPDDELQIGGLGIYLYKNIMDDVSYERINDENHLTLFKCWNI